jgi:hypothetical protein
MFPDHLIHRQPPALLVLPESPLPVYDPLEVKFVENIFSSSIS